MEEILDGGGGGVGIGLSYVLEYLQNEKCSFNGNLFYSFLKLKTGTNNQWKILNFPA